MGMVLLDVPVECTPGVFSEWVDVDLDTYVGGLGADVTGVIVDIKCVTGVVGVRKNGSVDERNCAANYRTCVIVGVDSSHLFEFFAASSNETIFIVGYTTAGWTLFTDLENKATGTSGSWVDVDCASICPNAIAVIVGWLGSFWNNGYDIGVRYNGATWNVLSNNNRFGPFGTMLVKCDGSQLIEQYIQNTNCDLGIFGYITSEDDSGVIMNADGEGDDYSLSSINNYYDLAALPSGAIGGIFFVTSSTSGSFALRKDGTTFERYLNPNKGTAFYVACSTSQLVEGKISTTNMDFWLFGYFKETGVYSGRGVGRGIMRGVYR